jgi:hypothetical protein
MVTLTDKLKAIDQQIEKHDIETKKLAERRETLVKQERLERAKKAGVVVGGYYKAIPVNNQGDVLIGKCLKIDTNHWRSEVQIVLQVPKSGRFMERTVFVSLDHWKFEKATAQMAAAAKKSVNSKRKR